MFETGQRFHMIRRASVSLCIGVSLVSRPESRPFTRQTSGLRPENTLPAMEVALDNLMSTLETDTGISADLVPVIDHDPYIEAAKCRLANGAS